MKSFIFWTLVLAGQLGLVSLAVRQGPRIWASLRDAADMFAPDLDWPAWTTAGAMTLVLWSIA